MQEIRKAIDRTVFGLVLYRCCGTPSLPQNRWHESAGSG